MTGLNSVSPTDHIQALYRLLLIRTGQRLQAENALRKTLTESLQNDDGHQNRTDFVKFYQTALKIPGTAFDPSETDLTGWPLALHQLAEPERSAITLFYLEVFSPRVLSEVLGLHIGELAWIPSLPCEEVARKSKRNRTTALDSIWYGAIAFFSVETRLRKNTGTGNSRLPSTRAEIESSDALKRQIEFDDRVAQELSALKLTGFHRPMRFENLLSEPNQHANSKTSRSKPPNQA